jgi:ParB/RepB/Spo0J family partition protein
MNKAQYESVWKPVTWLKSLVQVRKKKDDAEDALLIESIRQHGVLQPIGAREDGTVAWGHRRLDCAKAAGRKDVPVVILPPGMTETQYLALQITENTARANLTHSEILSGILKLLEMEPTLTGVQIASMLSIHESNVTRYRTIAKCPLARAALENEELGLLDSYLVAKAPEDQKVGLLALKRSGANREQLTKAVRKPRAPVDPADRTSRIPCLLPSGVSVVVSGKGVSLDDVIESLSEVLKAAKKARDEGLTAKTWSAAMKEKAGAT